MKQRWRYLVTVWQAILHNSGPLASVIAGVAALLLIFFTGRLVLFLLYAERMLDVENWFRIFTNGIYMDVVSIGYLAGGPLVFALLLPPSWLISLRYIVQAWWSVLLTWVLYMELVSIQFVGEFDSRPNRIFIEYLAYPQEVFSTVWAEYWYAVILVAIICSSAAWWFWRTFGRIQMATGDWKGWWRYYVLIPCLALTFICARGTFGHRQVNASTFAFSNDHLANQLALNSTYALAEAIWAMGYEGDPSVMYGTMPVDEMFHNVVQANGFDTTLIKQAIPFMHEHIPVIQRERPFNIVIILEESLGAEFCGCLGGLPLTPRLDELSEQGLLMTNFYSTGTRTVRGIEAVVAGFLPTPGRSVVKLGHAQHNFFTLAALLKEHGYSTDFIYGGESHFDNMRSFFLSNGFQRIYDQPTFKNPTFEGVWGVCDEDLFTEADRIFQNYTEDEPFFALVLSTSNHSPFDYPDNNIELYEEPKATRLNAMKYADYALGTFFDKARTRPYFDRTIFVVVADHNTRTYGNDLVPINKFRIPCLFLGPDVPVARRSTLASQIDVGPTLLSLAGIQVQHPMIGRDILRVPVDDPGRAIMQFRTSHAYRRGDAVVIQRPHTEALLFRYVDGRLEPDLNENPALMKEAKAHALLPGHLYREGLYRVK